VPAGFAKGLGGFGFCFCAHKNSLGGDVVANKINCLNIAIAITKAYGANGEMKQFPADMLKDLYKTIVKLEEEAKATLPTEPGASS